MAKGKKIRAVLELPEALIQHIQSYMSGEEAARTTILSKAWNSAWLTRPNLDFDERYFKSFVDDRFVSSFQEFVNKTVQRYENLNLKIESLRLHLHSSSYSLANELILKAIKMGAIDLGFRNDYMGSAFTFPNEVFASGDLIRLSVSDCKIDLGEEGKVSCSRLKSLSLEDVYLMDDDTIRKIIWSCPLIENLSLSSCKLMSETQDPASSTKSLMSFIESDYRNVGSVVGGPSIRYVFHRLKSLFLSMIDVRQSFFKDFSSKFPCLKDLTIHNCGGYRRIEISSPTLEWIDFKQDRTVLRATFDVPKIRKFTFMSSYIPELLFKTTSSEWKSDISIKVHYPLRAVWFRKLNRLLTNLSQSKVSLSLKIQSAKRFQCAALLQGLSRPEVENLKLDVPCSIYPALFDCLFRCCRPIYVTQVLFPESDFVEFVYKNLVQQAGSNCCIANQSMSGECNLEEEDVEYFDVALSVWRPLSLDALSSPLVQLLGIRIRLHFRWGR